MRDISEALDRWFAAGERVALATVISTWGSAPRPIGSKMAVASGGDMAGSVSGGCVEGAVFEEAQGVMESGRAKVVRFGVSNESAWEVGLSCGGTIEIFIEALAADTYATMKADLDAQNLFARAVTVAIPDGDGGVLGAERFVRPDGSIDGDGSVDGDGSIDGDGPLGHPDVAARLAARFGTFGAERVTLDDGHQVFVETFPPRRRLVIVGAVHVAIPLVTFANSLGFHTIVVDPRTAFATRERFPHAAELDTRWPDAALEELGIDENTFIALLSHDFKLDLPALDVALKRPVRYLGALGSKKTHGKRVKALEERGFDSETIGRIHNPIGLDLGGRRAEEIAVAVIAEMVAVDHGRNP